MTQDVASHVETKKPRKTTLGKKIVRWTRAEIDQLHHLYNRGVKRYDIAKKMNMPEDRIRQRLQWESQAGTLLEARKRRRAAQRLVTKEEQKSAREFFERVEPKFRPTEEALRQREKRLSAPPRNVAGFLFGDPPVGFSALERRT